MTKTTKKAKRALVAAKVVVLVAKMAGGAGQYWMWSKWITMRACTVGAGVGVGEVTRHRQREMPSKQRGNGCELKTDPPSAVGPAVPLARTTPTPPDPRYAPLPTFSLALSSLQPHRVDTCPTLTSSSGYTSDLSCTHVWVL
jgi:hypothetical protein